jgi:DivIVA domain-containing protein
VGTSRFELVRFGDAYDVDEVDDFLVRVEGRLTHRQDAALAAEISSARFTVRRIRPGYAMDQVDQHLDELADRAARGLGRS